MVVFSNSDVGPCNAQAKVERKYPEGYDYKTRLSPQGPMKHEEVIE